MVTSTTPLPVANSERYLGHYKLSPIIFAAHTPQLSPYQQDMFVGLSRKK